MKRAERHHLKQDEFVHWLDKALMWGMDHQRNIVNATLVVIGARKAGGREKQRADRRNRPRLAGRPRTARTLCRCIRITPAQQDNRPA